MKKIVKKDGYVYMAEIEPAYSTWVNLGKDPDSEIWKEEIEEMNIEKTKRKNTKKSED